jgi:hypothetical protein
MQQGEIVATGKGEVEIVLGSKHPHEVEVFFADKPVHVPCDHHHDKLHWEVHNRHHHHQHDLKHEHCHHEDNFVLIIRWDVAGVRVIEWEIEYR